MRSAIALMLVGCGLLMSAPSASAGPLACDLEAPGSDDYVDRLGPLLEGAAEEAHAVLGEQIAGYWLSRRDQGWDMGLAPGAVSVDEARSAIASRLRARFAADDAEYLINTFHLYAMPFSDAELRSVATELERRLAAEVGHRFFWVVHVGCLDGEAWRVEVGLYADATAADIAEVRELVAPFGDRVRVYPGGLVTPPSAAGGTTVSRLRSFIRLRSPRRCVRGSKVAFKTRPAARLVIRRIAVSVSGQKRKLVGGTRLTIRLARRGATRVRVVVRVGDGTRLAHTYAFRRC